MTPAQAVKMAMDPFLDLLYPPRCLLCGTMGDETLCAACLGQIAPVPEPRCVRCGQAFIPEARGCFHCARREPAFVRARAMGAYDGVLREAIHHLKYRDKPQLAIPLGRRLAAFARTEDAYLGGLNLDAVLPVPMHSVRQRRRGYNQSERLSRVVAEELGLRHTPQLLLRCRNTRQQMGLEGMARQRNLVGAFVARPFVFRRRLLLVDDVSTTSTTLHECAAALKAAGADAVYALTLAAD